MGCGNDNGKHAKLHFTGSRHSIFLNPKTLKVWCMNCDIEITHEKTLPLKSIFSSEVVENYEKPKPELKFQGNKGVVGLKNLGNTCYMNSSIQCLSNIRSFQRYFKSTLDIDELKANENTEQELITSFSLLIRDLWKGDCLHLSPKLFSDHFKQSCTFFKGLGQHDSQEFLRIFLEKMHDSLRFEQSIGKHRSIVSDTFASSLQSKVTCTNCGNFVVKDEEYYDISVSIPSPQELESYKQYSSDVLSPKDRVTFYNEKYNLWSKIQQIFTENKNVATIYDCLLNFCLPEELKEQFQCTHCHDNSLSRREVKICKPPNCLMIVIKRFKFNKVGSKVSTYVQFPINLDLRYFSTKNISCQYQLTGLIQHIGGVNGGHYVSYCKNYKNNNWYEFDDSRTRQISESQLLEKEAYILLYQRQIPEQREKFRTSEINALLPSYWCNLYYTVADPGTITQAYLLCSHNNLRPTYSLSQFTAVGIHQAMELRNKYHSDSSELLTVAECEQCLVGYAALNLRTEMELELINELNAVQPFEGPWYIISAAWINHWKEYCCHTLRGDILPPPINNEILFQEGGGIRKGLVPGKDYRGVNRHVWAAFYCLYRGGPEIKRLEVDIYARNPPSIACNRPPLTQQQLAKIKAIQSTYNN